MQVVRLGCQTLARPKISLDYNSLDTCMHSSCIRFDQARLCNDYTSIIERIAEVSVECRRYKLFVHMQTKLVAKDMRCEILF